MRQVFEVWETWNHVETCTDQGDMCKGCFIRADVDFSWISE